MCVFWWYRLGFPLGKPKNALAAFLRCFAHPSFPTARFCWSGSRILKARDEHYKTLRGSRCRCREQRGRGLDAGANLRGSCPTAAETGLRAAAMPPAFCGLRPLANLPRVLKSRSCSCFSGLHRLRGAYLRRAGQPATLHPAGIFAPPVGTVAWRGPAAQGQATRSPPCGDSALFRWWARARCVAVR